MTTELNRRQFLAAAATTAALLALGENLEFASAVTAAEGPRRKAHGISDDAYAKARTRAQVLVAKMTPAERIAQTGQRAPGIPRLAIPPYNYWVEALHGLQSGPPVTSFPVPLAMAAAWNPVLAHRIYEAVSIECRAHGNSQGGWSLYSPVTLNLHRDPRWGRCYEAPGEDPCLAATLAVQMVRGMQGDDRSYLRTTACSKHFICNNTEGDRHATSAEPDARSFWEYYTRAYRATATHGDVFTFMSAYNAVHGVPCSADRTLLTDILRDQWGFRGYVTSDCDAIGDIYDPHHYAPDRPTAAAMGMTAGCDLDCGGTYSENLQAALDRGLVTQDVIDEAVVRLMTVRVLLGSLDPPEQCPYGKISLKSVRWKDHDRLALDAARQSLVLLKNDGFLPLDPGRARKVAVIGPLGAICNLGGYSGNPATRISPLRGLETRLGMKAILDYIAPDRYVDSHGSVRFETSFLGTPQLGSIKDGDWVRYTGIDFTGKTELHASVGTGTNATTLDIHLDTLDGPKVATFTIPASAGRGFPRTRDLSAALSAVTGVHDIFLVFHGGGGQYSASVQRLTLRPLSAAAPAGDRFLLASSGCGVVGPRDDAAFQAAVDTARLVDVVVMVCGVDGQVSSEGRDRDSIGLTGVQHDLIQAVYAVNRNVVLVLSSANSVAVNWEQEHLPAILGAVCAGQQQGTAIAEALFGDYNPSGKLPFTWYRSLDQIPPFHEYDIHAGRTYQYFDGDPLYPFGHGLSYTTFRLGDLRAHTRRLGEGRTARYEVSVANTGDRAGTEIVQLYVTPPSSPVKRPKRQLAGFQRVDLKPGEQKTVVFDIPYTAQPFWYWSEERKQFVLQPGDAVIAIGVSSAATPLTATLTLDAPTGALPQPDAVETVAVPSHIA